MEMNPPPVTPIHPLASYLLCYEATFPERTVSGHVIANMEGLTGPNLNATIRNIMLKYFPKYTDKKPGTDYSFVWRSAAKLDELYVPSEEEPTSPTSNE